MAPGVMAAIASPPITSRRPLPQSNHSRNRTGTKSLAVEPPFPAPLPRPPCSLSPSPISPPPAAGAGASAVTVPCDGRIAEVPARTRQYIVSPCLGRKDFKRVGFWGKLAARDHRRDLIVPQHFDAPAAPQLSDYGHDGDVARSGADSAHSVAGSPLIEEPPVRLRLKPSGC